MRTVTAIYDSERDARFAREELMRAGLADEDVRIVSHDLSETRTTDTGANRGVWESIKDFFAGDDSSMYSEGLRRGGYLLTARVDDEYADDAISLLEGTNAIDLDERSAQWRAEGWSGANVAGDGSASATNVGERSIPIAEERLHVGKREVDRGGVRVRSYVVEEPVHEDVRLRNERVDVERRPAGGRIAGEGEDVFREQTLEVSERGEEPVIAKDAVVTDEVVVRKSEDEHIESVDDTVRRTKVDVDDARTGRNTKPGKKPRR